MAVEKGSGVRTRLMPLSDSSSSLYCSPSKLGEASRSVWGALGDVEGLWARSDGGEAVAAGKAEHVLMDAGWAGVFGFAPV